MTRGNVTFATVLVVLVIVWAMLIPSSKDYWERVGPAWNNLLNPDVVKNKNPEYNQQPAVAGGSIAIIIILLALTVALTYYRYT